MLFLITVRCAGRDTAEEEHVASSHTQLFYRSAGQRRELGSLLLGFGKDGFTQTSRSSQRSRRICGNAAEVKVYAAATNKPIGNISCFLSEQQGVPVCGRE